MPRPLVVFRRSLAHLTRFRYVSYVTFAADRAVLPAVTITLLSPPLNTYSGPKDNNPSTGHLKGV
jgi:hypothetical protein